MTEKTKKLCSGCRNDFYNHNRPEGCWCFERAKVVSRTSVGTWKPPPYTWSPQDTLSCHTPEGLHWLDKDDVRFKHNQAQDPL